MLPVSACSVRIFILKLHCLCQKLNGFLNYKGPCFRREAQKASGRIRLTATVSHGALATSYEPPSRKASAFFGDLHLRVLRTVAMTMVDALCLLARSWCSSQKYLPPFTLLRNKLRTGEDISEPGRVVLKGDIMKLCHVLPVVYAGCLALSLFGCGGNENGSGGDGASSTQVTSGEAVERAAGESTANDASETPETSGNMNNGYLEIDGQQLDVSQAGSDFLQNPLAGSKYYGKQAQLFRRSNQVVVLDTQNRLHATTKKIRLKFMYSTTGAYSCEAATLSILVMT